MRSGLTSRLLAISRELSQAKIRSRSDTARILRARKAAEFSANLAAALNFSSPDLRRLRELFAFYHLLLLSPRAIAKLPGACRKELAELIRIGPVQGRRELRLWPHIAKLAARLFRPHRKDKLLPYPSVQVRAQAGGAIKLHALTGYSSAELVALIPQALREQKVTVGSPRLPGKNQRVLLLGHFDPHGFGMLAATYLGLVARGLPEPDSILDYNSTGDYGKFWKRTLPRAAAQGYDHIITLDLTVYWRHPERTLKGIRQVMDNGVCLTIVDHHFDTLFFVKDILRAGAELVLTDIPGCFLGERIGRRELPFVWLGALGDRDLPMRYYTQADRSATSCPRQVPAVLAGLTSLMHSLSPPPKEIRKSRPFPMTELLESARHGIRSLNTALRIVTERGFRIELADGEVWFRPPVERVRSSLETELVETMLIGRMLLISQPLQMQGRVWYDVLEWALEAEPYALYALAGRYLPGTGFNFLVTKNWRQIAAPAPVSFVRPHMQDRAIGHFDAFWLNLPEQTADEVTRLIRRMNAYFGIKGLRIRPLIERLLARLVDARVHAAEQLVDNDNQNT